MINDEAQTASKRYRKTTINGVKAHFKAYISSDGKEKIVWKISDKIGNRATLDKKEAHIIFPQGTEIEIDGEKRTHIRIPRWMADVITNDFKTLRKDDGSRNSDTDTTIEEPSTSEGKNLENIFN